VKSSLTEESNRHARGKGKGQMSDKKGSRELGCEDVRRGRREIPGKKKKKKPVTAANVEIKFWGN